MSFKEPSFQDGIGSAAKAKEKALEQLRSKPPLDERVVAERKAKRLTARVGKLRKARPRRRAPAGCRGQAAEAAAKAAIPPLRTEAELKAARDARYAKRKARK